MSKLASNSFDLKHLPGTKNVVADNLSRDPFSVSDGLRLLRETYSVLVQEAREVEGDSVQEVFSASCFSQTCSPGALRGV